MIELVKVSDSVVLAGKRRELLSDVSGWIAPGRYVLLSRDPVLKKAAIDILAGLRPPKTGVVVQDGVGSWPIGRQAFIRGRLTGRQLLQFVARLYRLDYNSCVDVTSQLLTSPEILDMGVHHWSNPMRHEFGHAVALLPVFDVYWGDNAFQLPPGRFNALWSQLFLRRISGRSLVLSTSVKAIALQFCDKALILDQGQLAIDDDVERALEKFPLRPTPSHLGEALAESEEVEEADDDFL